MQRYYYRSRIGLLEIKPSRSRDGRVELWIQGEPVGSYASAAHAASDVSSRATGWSEWDTVPGSHPDELGEWTAGAPAE